MAVEANTLFQESFLNLPNNPLLAAAKEQSKGRAEAPAERQATGRQQRGEKQAMMSDNRKVGTGLLSLGGIFILLGVLLFFDAALLAMGEMRASLRFVGVTLVPAGTNGQKHQHSLNAWHTHHFVLHALPALQWVRGFNDTYHHDIAAPFHTSGRKFAGFYFNFM